MLLADRVVIVAGVGPGLGAVLASRLVDHGAHVVVTARSAGRLADLRTALGEAALDVPADLSLPGSAASVVGRAVAHFGRVDGIVYNAAAFPPLLPVAATSREDVDGVLGVSVTAPMDLARASLPAMPAGGSIVFIGSASVRQPKLGFGLYNVGKHAMLGLARSLALELGPAGIRVNTIAAGKIDGSRLQEYFCDLAARRNVPVEQVRQEYVSRIPLGRVPTPDEYADVAAFLLSDLARAVTGHTLDVNGGEYFN